MNVPATDPHWGWWIIWYFYLGGIAAGAYFLATLAEFFGTEQDRRQTRVGYLIAAPLIGICGVLLIVDLEHPARFWHMLLDRDSWLPHLKIWSPMSIGAWAVLLFSLISSLSWIGVVAEAGWLGLGHFQTLAIRLHRGFWGRTFDLLGVSCGFFIASYTGALLTATNQPVWSDSPWIGVLFLASSAGTGLAAIKLLSAVIEPTPASTSNQTPAANSGIDLDREKLSRHPALDAIEPWAWALELITAACLLYSLGSTTLQVLLRQGLAIPFLGGAIGMGVLIPAMLHWRRRGWSGARATLAAMSVLIGGFCLRYSILSAPRVIRASTAAASDHDHAKSHPQFAEKQK